VLHVSTTVFATGGHTRTIARWASNDPESSHSLVLTDQQNIAVPGWLTDAIAGSGGAIAVLPPASRLAQARRLRAAARQGFDLIVLHTFPEDTVPVVALATRDCPPVALLNHADHIFWLGASVADAIVNQREIGAALAAARRGARLNLVLPNPLPPHARARSKSDARVALGLSLSGTVVLSIGTAAKYSPTRDRNFFRAASRILEMSAQAHVYVVGVPPQSACPYEQRFSHDRLHLLGSVEDPSLFQEAADVYLEGFPLGSQTALLEAAAAGAAPVRAYAPGSELLVASDACFSGLVPAPDSESAYVECATRLIQDGAARERLASVLASRIRTHHTGLGWRESLEASYARLAALTHEPREVSPMPAQSGGDDLALSRWHAGKYEGAGGQQAYVTRRVGGSVNMARVFRRGGDYRTALALLLATMRAFGVMRRDVLLPVGALPMHWIRDRWIRWRSIRAQPRSTPKRAVDVSS
jgi:hypothetical protein